MLGKRKLALKKAALSNQVFPNWLRAVAGAFAIVTLVGFWAEIWRLIVTVTRILLVFVRPVAFEPVPGASIAFGIILENVIVFGAFFFASLWLVSQFVLPVRSPEERAMVFQRLQLYMSGAHGAAVFVKDGQENASKSETRKSGPGVAFVDHSSALVLEKQPGNFYPHTIFGQIRALIERTQHPVMRMSVRAVGPGIAFTEAGERIRGAVDLRKQVRVQPGVQAVTRDDHAMTTTIVVGFTVGQKPDELRVGFTGPNAEDLRIITLKSDYLKPENEEETRHPVTVIQSLEEGLDTDDRNEVFRFMKNAHLAGMVIADAPAARVDASPFIFDDERVKAAIYSQARNIAENAVSPWTDLPPQVATQVFRNMLPTQTLDYWYQTEGSAPAPIRALKGTFSQYVRQMGLLSYQLVERLDGRYFQSGDVWDESQLNIYPPQPFRSRKVLRERGIKVLFASFSELEPVEKGVRQLLLNRWQAHWQIEAQTTQALYEMQAIKVKNEARARAEREMVRALAGILKDPRYSQEVLAIRVLQALEAFAADSATRKLLPQDTIKILWTLGSWMRPELSSGPHSQQTLGLEPETGSDDSEDPFSGIDPGSEPNPGPDSDPFNSPPESPL